MLLVVEDGVLEVEPQEALHRLLAKFSVETLSSPSKGKNMNANYLISILQDSYTTISVKFENNNCSIYTYKCPLSEDVRVGDFVIVPPSCVKNYYNTGQIVEVHEAPRIHQGIEYKWIVQRIDDSRYKQLLEVEDDAKKLLETIEEENNKKMALKEFEESLSPDLKRKFSRLRRDLKTISKEI
jgi:hypothetical protein